MNLFVGESLAMFLNAPFTGVQRRLATERRKVNISRLISINFEVTITFLAI